eukprot:Gregarina_sp_Poly_1__1299@NODE_1319_length_4396_cov_42_175560_g188_i1_p2_GENE_NODE_1319_length_4396_cov_42_175560_g188_i1NODE_1319_length_4396_cov_42_175560_g188_i1_p2_ORF_typecomplete_len465_score74_61ANTH/PF07651_16/3e07KAR9/PF08580_10/0_02HasA/PF06438_12/3_4HasA/PF06438_12/1_4e02SR25/PF10500_9/0_42_NODE_1319_length_4396_cov_42_175560_g188_i111742568
MWRNLLESISQWTLSGYEAVIYSCLTDDVKLPSLGQVHDVVEGLMGCRRDVNQTEAIQIFDKSISSRWTWKVVFKSLYVYHLILKYQSTTPQWIATFSDEFSAGHNAVRFREGEGVDIQAESHSKTIRLYCLYLRHLASNFVSKDKSSYAVKKSEFLKLNNLVSLVQTQLKNAEIAFDQLNLTEDYGDKDDEELVKELEILGRICQEALRIFLKFSNSKKKQRNPSLNIPLGFKELTTGVFLEVYKDIRYFMVVINVLTSTLISRAIVYAVPADLKNLQLLYANWKDLSEQSLIYSRFIQSMPELKVDLIPENPLISDRKKRQLAKLFKKNDMFFEFQNPVDYSLDEEPEKATSKRQRAHRHSAKRPPPKMQSLSSSAVESSSSEPTSNVDSSSSSLTSSSGERHFKRRHGTSRNKARQRRRHYKHRHESSTETSVSSEPSPKQSHKRRSSAPRLLDLDDAKTS